MSGPSNWDCFGPGSPHRADLEHVEQTRQGASVDMHIYRCRACGQFYGYQRSELSDWSTQTGHDFSDVTQIWIPLGPDELEDYRRDPNYTPRSNKFHRHDTGWH